MGNKKIKALVLASIFSINLLSPIGNLVKWEKDYLFNTDYLEVDGDIEPVYSPEASLYDLPKKIKGYRKAGKIHFNEKKDVMVFRFDKKKIAGDQLSLYVYQDGVKKSVSLDADGDERILTDDMVYSTPIIVNDETELKYEIESENKSNLEAPSILIGINTSDFRERLTLGIDAADADEEIVSRKGWGADETLRYSDNPKWVAIFKQQEEAAKRPKTEWQLKQDKRITDIRSYLSFNFPLEDTPVSTIKSENGHELVWPVEKTRRVEKIFIHHTAEAVSGDERDDAAIMRGIYYYHAMVRGWGDIGYNYVVGRDGKIYEGRAGGDYAVAAHNLWNNKSTVGISVMGNFEITPISEVQKNGVDRAIGILSKRFGIDLNGKSIAHKECSASETCLLKDYQTYNLIGHKDAGSTSCPGKNLYVQLGDFREYGKLYSNGLRYVENSKIEVADSGLKKGPMIKIRLSYTGETVDINSYTPEKVKITLGSKSGYTTLKNFHFEKRGNDQLALVVGKKSARVPYLKLSSTVLEVNSWNRKPTWDKSGNINDNKFRGSLIITNDNGKIVLINELPLEDYLKGIAEVSNDENYEKAKTILVAARTYALWYTDPANRKFPGKPYDGSDNPDEFQKYMGYSFELRSNKIGQLVDETNGIVIKYAGKLIKPWYFNQSTGKTKSYTQYCEERKVNGSLPANQICEDIPYLQSAYDPAGITDGGYKGHGVGISGAGAKYLAEMENKNYDDIIRYFLNGVTIEKTIYQ